MPSTFVAFLDACVLYPANLRDILLSFAAKGIYQIRWSPDVLEEVERNVGERAKAATPEVARSGASYLRQTMERAFPDAMVDKASYAALIPALTNEEKDRHVLAAAILGRADVLVTSNGKHFPPASVSPFDIEVQDPDSFLVYQFDLAKDEVIEVLEQLAQERRPPLSPVEDILTKALIGMAPRFAEKALEYWRNKNQSQT